MKNTTKTIVLSMLILVAGCIPDTSGIDPPDDQLIYPVGLALLEGEDADDGRYLAVANSNFDLNYNSGTMNALDLKALYEILGELESNGIDSSYYQDKSGWFSDDQSEIHIPTELLAHTASTLRTGSFASDLELTSSGKRLVLPVRGEKAIFVVDVNTDDPNQPVFECGQGADQQCDGEHKVESNENATLPLEPYGVETLEYGNYVLGFSTHRFDGDVSLFVIAENDVTRPSLVTVSDNVVFGASPIAVRPNADNFMYSDILVAGERDYIPRIIIMRVLSDSENGSMTNPYFNDVGYIAMYDELYDFTDPRGIAVTKSGKYAYITFRSPESLVKVDLENEEVIDMVSLGYASEPSAVSLYEHEGDPDDESDDLVFAFVVCFQRDQLFVLETDMMMQPHVLNTGVGPQAIAFDYAQQKAMVANFTESTISLYDIDPAERRFTYTTVTPLGSDISARVKIGVPDFPEGHN